MLRRGVFHLQALQKGLINSMSAFRQPTPQFALAGGALEPSVAAGGAQSLRELGEMLGEALWLAVPKSKISPSRKRMKWKQHIPAPIGWSRCAKCGEPKRPHRICTKHVDICAMGEEEYIAHLRMTKSVDSVGTE